MKNLNPILRGILAAVGTFAIVLVIQYVIALFKGTAYYPEWLSLVGLSILSGLLTVFGPNAEERKRNRENLMKKFKK